ncbi:MAG: DNA mismatch repair endonuclease MutL [Candidatus Woesearchaeota archaeon]
MTDTNDIRLLPDELINKIAAGEVIERPANVVKEIVENALDAGARKVNVSLEDGGKSFIRIEDDGSGISDITTAIERHATSKIHTEEDLDRISTLGFRGEALASICAISKVEIQSKTEMMSEGIKAIIENGSVLKTSKVPMDTGTIITIRNLFYNTPARQKFLKSTAVERRHCQDILTKLSLCQPKVDIRLSHDGNELLHATPHDDLKQRVASIYDVETAKSMLPISFEDDLFRITGLTGIPYSTRKDKSRQTILINHRPVSAPAVRQGAYDAYQSLRFLDQHPVFIISIELDPTLVDVNVHPTKQVVRLSHEEQLERAVFEACTKALESNNLTPEVNASEKVSSKPQQTSFPPPEFLPSEIHPAPDDKQTLLDIQPEPEHPSRSHEPIMTGKESIVADDREQYIQQDHISGEKQPVTNETRPGTTGSQDNISVEHDKTAQPASEERTTPNVSETGKSAFHHDFGITRIFGQLSRLYILAASSKGLVIIDQHAAEERILFEEFLDGFKKDSVPSQALFKPIISEVSPLQMEEYQANAELLSKAGFRIDEFGETEIKISAIPELFGNIEKSFFTEILDEFSLIRKGKVTSSSLHTLATKACKAAVKAGDELTPPQMKRLIKRMESCKRPFTCPHGRPTIISITPYELEKMFRRKA